MGSKIGLVWICMLYIVLSDASYQNRDDTNSYKFRFTKFIQMYNRSYLSDVQFNYRFQVFQESLRRQARLNAARKNDYDAWYGVNQFSDLTTQEFKDMYLSHLSPAYLSPYYESSKHHQENVYEFSKTNEGAFSVRDIPKQVDWRDKGVIGAVRNQGPCGACWAFSVMETAASMQAIRTGNTVTPLSPQQLVDCAWNNNGCLGGDTCRALKWLVEEDVHIATEAEYPFKDKAHTCGIHPKTGIRVANYTCQNLKKSEDTMMSLLATVGPLAVAVDANTWHDYMGGIIQYHCGDFINHAVQIVGYDLTGPVPHYIVRNDWGSSWGINGFLLIKAGDNMCQIASEVASVHLK